MISTPKTLLSALLLLSASLHASAENLKARWDKGSHQYQDAPSVKEHWILVGPDGKLEFVPPYIHIPVGDTVVFQFRPKNHTVTQSSFDNPCMSNGGFKSGFMPVDPSVQEGDLPTFKIKVENTDPIWGYCGQVNHCQSGMVFAINPDQNSDKTFENFLTIAKGGKSGDKDGGDANAWPTTTATRDDGVPIYTTTGADGMTTTYTNPSGNKVWPTTWYSDSSSSTGTETSTSPPAYTMTPIHIGADGSTTWYSDSSSSTGTETSTSPPVYTMTPIHIGADGSTTWYSDSSSSTGTETSTSPPVYTMTPIHIGADGSTTWYSDSSSSTGTETSTSPPVDTMTPIQVYTMTAADGSTTTYTNHPGNRVWPSTMWDYSSSMASSTSSADGVQPTDGSSDSLASWDDKKASTKSPFALKQGHHKTHRITVGADGKLEYAPNNIKADVGDFVIFQFKPKNHTVTRSSFENPCQSNGGFKSGFRPVAADAQHFPTFTIKVHDDKPIWGYCGQVNHCQSGMVFAINAPDTGNTFDAFLSKAKSSSASDGSGSKKPAVNVGNIDEADSSLAASTETDSSSDTLKKYAVPALALLGANIIIGLAILAFAVLIYIKRNSKPSAGPARYAPVLLKEQDV
ncbi:hypothetical protein D9611_001472 [Ephemerocybe angulata]|uniref:Cupredoxin n=1 Tax=Ephemerocybe angulata TaxID=980116 RepID=A0A8H5FMV5_9AGAR|nr:hypothetical protein D9611_001472 [Tulosesus angulatus]